MSMTKRPKTPNRGAADDRARILRKVRSVRREWAVGSEVSMVLGYIEDWILGMVPRNKARKGGL